MKTHKHIQAAPSLTVPFRLGAVMFLLTLFIAAPTRATDCAPAPSGLVAWWPGNGNANEIIGTNNGTLIGSAGYAAGEVGQAFSVSGPANCVVVPSSPSIAFGTTSPMSIEFWAYSSGSSGCAHILGKRGGSGNEYQIGDCGGLFFNADGGGVSSGQPMPQNQWVHLAGTFDGSTLAIYINGVLAGTASGTLGTSSSEPFKIGASDVYGGFNGWIDEVAIYNRALSANEIAAIYAAGSAGKCTGPNITTQPQSQLGYWGKSVSFSVAATNGIPPYNYQWLKDGVAIADATNSLLVLTNLQATNAGAYLVIVTDSGTKTLTDQPAISLPATLTVNPAGVSVALYAGVTIDGVVSQTYGIQTTTDLSNTNSWAGAANFTLTLPTQMWYDTQPASQSHRFYRVVPGPISVP